jgi:hypothetical protein
MKKLFLSVLLASFALQAPFALANETKSFVFNGQKSEQQNLKSQKYHTEYKTEVINTTCYETVQIGTKEECRYETECDSIGWQRPLPPGEPPPPSSNPPSEPPSRPEPPSEPPSRPEPPERPEPPSRPEPPERPLPPGEPPPPSTNPPSWPPERPEPPSTCREVYRCYTVPQYEERAYACQKTVSTPYQVKDYDVVASVFYNFGQVPAGINAAERFNTSIKGDQITNSVVGSGQLVIFSERNETQKLTGKVLSKAVNFKIEFASRDSLLSPFAVEPNSATLKQGVLRYNIGVVEHPDTFQVHLNLKQKDTLLKRDLAQNEYRLVDGGTHTIVEINLVALGVTLDPKKKLEAKIISKLVLSGTILNRDILPSTLEKLGKAKLKVE